MANSSSESNFQSDILGLSHISSSLFNVPEFFVGFISKGLTDADFVRSPTSHLDLRGLSSFKNPFSFRSPRSSSDHEDKRKWDCAEVGLGIVNSFYGETRATEKVSDFPKGKSIIFRPQVKKTNFPKSSRHYDPSLVFSEKSYSLPTNYMVPSFSQSISPFVIDGNEGIPLVPEVFENIVSYSSDSTRPTSSLTGCSHNPISDWKTFYSESKTNTLADSPMFSKTQSLPISIDSISVKEIELSEYYTCIISHGANPKTTHIFGDCVLECGSNKLSFGKKEEQGAESPHVAKRPEGLASRPSNELLNNCYSYKTKQGEDMYFYRGEKSFCSFKCRNEDLLAEDEAGEMSNKSSECSPESSSHEDLFLLGLHFAE